MATVLVIHDPADEAFITGTLLKPLPSLGFDRWVSGTDEDKSTLDALPTCEAFIVVVSDASRRAPAVRALTARALAALPPTIAVQLDGTQPDDVAIGLGKVPAIERSDTDTDASVTLNELLRALLPWFLPPVRPTTEPAASSAVRIEWNEEIFSGYLVDAMTRTDFSRCQALLSSLKSHLAERPYPYPAAHARTDLKTLRRKRQFALMDRYSELVMSSGTEHPEVRRQRAQALIELKRIDEAVMLLKQNIEHTGPADHEWREAHGLIGRAYKQLYIEAPGSDQAADRLHQAIEEYRTVYDLDDRALWHGVNEATLLLRAHRDGLSWAQSAGARDTARRIAQQVLSRADEEKAAGIVPIWDCASRVEALVTLERFDEASQALDEYLSHPDWRQLGSEGEFEIGAMLRQFAEVIRIQDLPGGEGIYQRLLQAVDRFRAGGATSTPPQRDAAEKPGRLPILIHLSDPAWVPGSDVTGLKVSSRMRTVVAAHASPDAISALLRDPIVISIEESRAVDTDYESGPPLQFIGVGDEYADTVGSFNEKGAGALIAIIDDGIDVLHEAFLDDQGRSRIVGIWDQRDPSGPPPPKFDYGCYHSALDIDAYIKGRGVPGTLTRNPNGHGTHVASIAAGRAVGAFKGGVAPEASLLVVIARLDGDIGYSKAHVDALAFIDSVATERTMPVVVNVSKGTNAGAHDGKSALEVAFDEFAGGGRKPGRVVIKSAGNERGFNRHAAVLIGAGEEAMLPWNRQERAGSGFERVELWWDSSDILQFRLGYPDGVSWSDWVTERAPDLAGVLGAGGEFHMQLTRLHVDNGDNQLRVEIGGRKGGVCSGTWTVHIKAVTVSSGRPVHAWIERGGPAASGFTNWAHPEMTLTVPGTADTVITVGAVASNSAQLGEFSSFGPTRDDRKKPDLVAPGIGVIGARGGTDQDVRPESGTSMAAPHVAGAVALALSRAVSLKRRPATASQIRAALTRKTRNFNGHHDPGRGYGVLDVSKFLAAF